jgi:hypothetical protein
MKNKGFESNQKVKNGWVDEKIKDEIFESIPVDEIDYDKIDLEVETTEEKLELEAKKILNHNNQKNMGYITDARYYSTIFFICQEDRDEFFQKLGVSDLTDVFINGYDLAKRLGIDIQKKVIHLPKPKSLKV